MFNPKEDVIISSQRGMQNGELMEDLLSEDDKKRIHDKVIDKYELYFRTEDEKKARLSAYESSKSLEQLRNSFLNMFG